MEYRFVCPDCGEEDECKLTLRVVNGRRTPVIICGKCGWEGTKRKFVYGDSVISSGSSRSEVPVPNQSQLREPGDGICPECREILTTLDETSEGYCCPECGELLFSPDEGERITQFMGRNSQERG